MLTPTNIKNYSFEKSAFGGYRAEDVDLFINEVASSYDKLYRENGELIRKLEMIADKLEQYRGDEDSIRSALLNAQKTGDSIIRESTHRAELMIQDATIKANRIVNNAQHEIQMEAEALNRIKNEVSSFKASLLSIYKEHVELISNIPARDENESEKDIKQAEKNNEEAQQAEKEQRTSQDIYQEDDAEMSIYSESITFKPLAAQDDRTKAPVPEMIKGNLAADGSEPVKFENSPAGVNPQSRILKTSFANLKFGEDYDISSDRD